MNDVRLVHTAHLDAAALRAARELLYGVFGDVFTDDDWDHALGGIHALVWDERQLIGHASVVQRRISYGGRALRAGYVEGVAVRADRRRQGLGLAMIQALNRVIRGAYELGALGSTDEATRLYASLGWQQWRGPTFALTPTGVVRTSDDDGAVYVLRVTLPLDLEGELTCDWRDGDVW
jgi:aminoglycoside 2'-N-acetyltransferase I